MKTLISVVLSAALLLQGCFTYSQLTQEERENMRPRADEDIWLFLRDGSTIKANEYRFIRTEDSSDFVFGRGKISDASGNTTEFSGQLNRIDIDSMTMQQAVGYPLNDSILVCRLKTGATIWMCGGQFVVVTPGQGAGFYCFGRKQSSGDWKPYSGKIDEASIEKIEVKKFSVVGTVLEVALVGSAFALMAASLENFGSSSFGGSWSWGWFDN